MENIRKKSKIVIEAVGVCDMYEVGNWTDCYPSIKLGYKNDEREAKISDVAFYIKNGEILGYFMAYSVVNLVDGGMLPIYSKKLVLYDFAISARAYAKYGLALINFLMRYARKNGYKAIEIKKISKYNFFLEFLSRHFKLKEHDDVCYIVIDEPKIKLSEKHLLIYDNDSLVIDDIYFLYDLKFSIGKTRITRRLNDKETISVDRVSGKIKFPTNVEVIKDDVALNSHTKSIVYLVCEAYRTNQVKNLKIDFSIDAPNTFEVYVDDVLYVNKAISNLVSDIEYIASAKNKGITCINPCIIDYDMNSHSFSCNFGGTTCDDLIKKAQRKLQLQNR